MKSIFITSLLILLHISVFAQQKIHFQAKDGLKVTADLYMKHQQLASFIILFHQAGWSRGEYAEIALKLNEMGFNCLAVDQRSGGTVNGVTNETKIEAQKSAKGTTYIDAITDMEAAIAYVKNKYTPKKMIIWGSSYSSALALKLAGDQPDQVDAVLAFAPGEYFTRLGKPADFIKQSAQHIKQPAFITSAKNEKQNWWTIYQAIPSEAKAYYLPETTGNHGSRALWDKFSDSEGYWNAVTPFLMKLK